MYERARNKTDDGSVDAPRMDKPEGVEVVLEAVANDMRQSEPKGRQYEGTHPCPIRIVEGPTKRESALRAAARSIVAEAMSEGCMPEKLRTFESASEQHSFIKLALTESCNRYGQVEVRLG